VKWFFLVSFVAALIVCAVLEVLDWISDLFETVHYRSRPCTERQIPRARVGACNHNFHNLLQRDRALANLFIDQACDQRLQTLPGLA